MTLKPSGKGAKSSSSFTDQPSDEAAPDEDFPNVAGTLQLRTGIFPVLALAVRGG